MKGRNKRNCSYTILLAVSLFIAAVVGAYGLIRDGEMGQWLIDTAGKAQATIASVQTIWEKQENNRAEEDTDRLKMEAVDMGTLDRNVLTAENADGFARAELADGSGDAVSDGNAKEAPEEAAEDNGTEQTEEETDGIPEQYTAERTYFDDALFIGDSRTVGLQEYGDLGNAEVVADLGMSVYKIFSKKFYTVSGEKKLLETVLTERQYGKIYLMMGINELGYDFDHTVAKYEQMIERIRALQPQALIFLEANLHITEKKSATSPIYNNENINRFNTALAQMADGKAIFYLDANELFDDETGNLSEACTTDDTHILAKYYPEWTAWLLEHARKTDTCTDEMEPDVRL